MTNYYYSENPDVVHEKKDWSFTLRGHEFHFVTDNGVFSKRTVDFGTRTLLEAFSFTDLPAGDLLDVGAGYGPIGLALAKEAPERQVDLVDVNELALSLARENAANNHVANVAIFTSDQYAAVEKQYAAILSNPSVRAGKQVVTGILVGAKDHLLPGGTLTIVLQKKQGAPSAQKTMQETFGNATIVKKNKGYYIIQSVKQV
ncbi:class I SAM-dependent methyltransferase [Loigolactobacillus backii]|uniref:class I SAM-dependent methyltransferase n=1 Tax=Loigolactobacillus backii TaxID=375175 RepID=UPI0007F0E004|nr:class I SAM-dependent methyltransferase [Loigolactobacillus backii]ANK59103.1 16S rRNA methyltransferase [Loigolactobacillus backii]